MNERIKQLAEQAGLEMCKCGCDMPTRQSAKFAELIIQECARVARATPCPYTDELMSQQLGHTWDMASSAAGREIIQHFGVER